jgi:hypothetical protein
VTVSTAPSGLPVTPDVGRELPVDLSPADRRAPWRPTVVGLTSICAPAGIGVADPLLGWIVIAIEVVVVLTIIGTALFGSQTLSERAFRLLRWIANRPEPPGPGRPIAPKIPRVPRGAFRDARRSLVPARHETAGWTAPEKTSAGPDRGVTSNDD